MAEPAVAAHTSTGSDAGGSLQVNPGDGAEQQWILELPADIDEALRAVYAKVRGQHRVSVG